MSEKTVVTCDYCGRQKRDVNHFFKVTSGAGGSLLFARAEDFLVLERDLNVKDACGFECAIKALSEWMNQK